MYFTRFYQLHRQLGKSKSKSKKKTYKKQDRALKKKKKFMNNV